MAGARNGNGQFRKSTAVAEKQARACELREQGWTFRRIAAELGYAHPAAAAKAVNKALEKLVIPSAEQLLRSEVSKIEVLDEQMAHLISHPPIKTTSIGRTQWDPRTCTCDQKYSCPACNAKVAHDPRCEVKPVLDERIIISATIERRQLSEHLARMTGYTPVAEGSDDWQQWALGVLRESEDEVKLLRAENNRLRLRLAHYEMAIDPPGEG